MADWDSWVRWVFSITRESGRLANIMGREDNPIVFDVGARKIPLTHQGVYNIRLFAKQG